MCRSVCVSRRDICSVIRGLHRLPRTSRTRAFVFVFIVYLKHHSQKRDRELQIISYAFFEIPFLLSESYCILSTRNYRNVLLALTSSRSYSCYIILILSLLCTHVSWKLINKHASTIRWMHTKLYLSPWINIKFV